MQTCFKCGRDFSKALKELATQMYRYDEWKVSITCPCGMVQEYEGNGMEVREVE